jgi:cob(I)alamin adenosyltransferase
VSKASLRVEAYGSVDEASSAVGLAVAAVTDIDMGEALAFVQQRLFNCSGLLATPDSAGTSIPRISPEDVAALERAIDAFESRAGVGNVFVIEGGSEAAARLHVARAIVRRAERQVVRLAAEEPVDAVVLSFLNRCSDLLYSAARCANAIEGVGETPWDPNAPIPDSLSGDR